MSSDVPDAAQWSVRLRRVRSEDIAWLAEMATTREAVGPHNWPGTPPDRAKVHEQLSARLDADGLISPESGRLVVEIKGGQEIGEVAWRSERWGPSPRSRCLAFGIALLPDYRGQGHGTTAQRLLINYLFDLDPLLNRIQSDTAVDNIAERRSLSKIGMIEEGRVREAEHRDGRYYDHILYSILRSEWNSPPDATEAV